MQFSSMNSVGYSFVYKLIVSITVLRENRIKFVNKRSEVIDMASIFFV